jgi:hypothetical protein
VGQIGGQVLSIAATSTCSAWPRNREGGGQRRHGASLHLRRLQVARPSPET